MALPSSIMPAANMVTAIVNGFRMEAFSHWSEISANRRIPPKTGKRRVQQEKL